MAKVQHITSKWVGSTITIEETDNFNGGVIFIQPHEDSLVSFRVVDEDNSEAIFIITKQELADIAGILLEVARRVDKSLLPEQLR